MTVCSQDRSGVVLKHIDGNVCRKSIGKTEDFERGHDEGGNQPMAVLQSVQEEAGYSSLLRYLNTQICVQTRVA